MGGGSSKPQKKKNIKNPVDQNWDSIQTGQNFNIVRNKTDGRQAQQYTYVLDNRYDPCGQAHIFETRSKSVLPIVRSFDHQWEAKGKGLVPKNNFRVITERLPHRLTSCPQLSIDQSLYVLDRALQGYNFLYRKVGPFDVNSNMIGFTPEGEVKVWHNQNFGKNYPFHEKRTLQSTRNDQTHRYDSEYVPLEQIEMVRNIVNVVEDRCEEGQFAEPFRTSIRQNIGFQQARRLVSEELNDSERIRLNRVDLLKNVIKSRVSKIHSHNLGSRTVGVTNLSTINPTLSVLQNPLHTTTSVAQPVHFNNASTYQTNYTPVNNTTKNAYSFSYQKTISA